MPRGMGQTLTTGTGERPMNDTTKHEDGRAGTQRAGRDARGRFVAGNKGGPGNPFARQTARLRKALLAVVTDEDMQAIAAKLVELSRAGDVAAIKLLLAYVIGRPAEAVDPDTVDIHEFQLYDKASTGADAIGRVMELLPVETACSLVRAVRPILAKAKRKDLLERFQQADEEEDDEDQAEAEETSSEIDEQDVEAVRQGLGQETSEWAERGREPVGPMAKPGSPSGTGKRTRRATRPSANGRNGSMRSLERPTANGHDGRHDGGCLHDRV
jgi:hypothetical protein